MNVGHHSLFDRFLIKCDNTLRAVASTLSPPSSRPSPATDVPESILSPAEKKQSACLMRVNHTGEVCAQALYLGQSLTAHEKSLAKKLQHAAQEEIDHLAWCETRLQELGDRKSYLNPFWFTGSLLLGTIAGCAGDKWNLGFLAETESQVYHHLTDHLAKLPLHDHKSRAILLRMQEEEKQHATVATTLGAASLPFPIRISMRFFSKIMTTIARYI